MGLRNPNKQTKKPAGPTLQPKEIEIAEDFGSFARTAALRDGLSRGQKEA